MFSRKLTNHSTVCLSVDWQVPNKLKAALKKKKRRWNTTSPPASPSTDGWTEPDVCYPWEMEWLLFIAGLFAWTITVTTLDFIPVSGGDLNLRFLRTVSVDTLTHNTAIFAKSVSIGCFVPLSNTSVSHSLVLVGFHSRQEAAWFSAISPHSHQADRNSNQTRHK